MKSMRAEEMSMGRHNLDRKATSKSISNAFLTGDGPSGLRAKVSMSVWVSQASGVKSLLHLILVLLFGLNDSKMK